MFQMVMFILDDIAYCPQVLDAWEAAGATGITILESTGLGRMRKAMGLRDDLPLMPTLLSLLKNREEHHRTLITVTDSEALVERLIAATQEVVGQLAAPNQGVIFVLPVLRAIGLTKDSGQD